MPAVSTAKPWRRVQNAFYLDDTTSGWTIRNNSFVNCKNGLLFNGGRDNLVTANHFERVHAAVYLVSECPGGMIMYSAIAEAYAELRRTLSWPAWAKSVPTTLPPCVPARAPRLLTHPPRARYPQFSGLNASAGMPSFEALTTRFAMLLLFSPSWWVHQYW